MIDNEEQRETENGIIMKVLKFIWDVFCWIITSIMIHIVWMFVVSMTFVRHISASESLPMFGIILVLVFVFKMYRISKKR